LRKDKNKTKQRGQATLCVNTFSSPATVTIRYPKATGPVKSMAVQAVVTAGQIWS